MSRQSIGKNLVRSLMGCISLCLYQVAFAQSDTLNLKTVQVTSSRGLQYSAGSKLQKIDSLSMAQYSSSSLGDLLSSSTPIFIKNYGPGSISTISFRGTAASHTAVLWNGFNIQNGMRGQADFSIIPVGAIDEVQVQYGGNSALYGSGAIGGSIYLSTKVSTEDSTRCTLRYSMGSFGSRSGLFKISSGLGKYGGISIGSYQGRSENNFTFKNKALSGSPELKLAHASYLQEGVVLDYVSAQRGAQKFGLHYWYHHNWREFPPTMLQSVSMATQTDVSHRIAADWQLARKRSLWMARTAYFYENLNYDDPLTGIFSSNFTHNSITELEARFYLSTRKQWQTGIQNNVMYTSSPDHNPESHNQWRNAIFSSYKYTSIKLATVLSLRAERFGTFLAPLTWSAGGEWQFLKALSLKSRISGNYRYPTFNDLYWKPGGNPALKPEQSLNAEAGLRYQYEKGAHKLSAEATLFSSRVKNWIIWLPDSVSMSIWSPQNVAEVWSRGIEYSLNYRRNLSRRSAISLSALYSWLQSTNERSAWNESSSLHRQLIYTPRQAATFRLNYNYRIFSLSYAHSYTGYRFTSTDNLDYLNPYQLASLHLSASFPLFRNELPLNLFVNVRNLWNEEYQVMAWRPMPGRYYEVGIKISTSEKSVFNKSKNK